VRSWRTRVVKPGPPSDEYLLPKPLRCERCGARMRGTYDSRPPVRRYMRSTRRYGDPCGEPIVKAEPLEEQLVDWIRDFRPDEPLLDLLLDTIRETAANAAEQPAARRAELVSQFDRLQELYVMGDLTKAQYVMRRQAIEEELQRSGPPEPTPGSSGPERYSKKTSGASGNSRRRRRSVASCSPRSLGRCGRRMAASSPSSHTAHLCRISRH